MPRIVKYIILWSHSVINVRSAHGSKYSVSSLCVHPSPALVAWSWLSGTRGGHLNYPGTLPMLLTIRSPWVVTSWGPGPPPPAPLTPVRQCDQHFISQDDGLSLRSSHSYLSRQLGTQIQDNDSQKSQNTLETFTKYF